MLKLSFIRSGQRLLCALILGGLSAMALAQDYPSHPIRLIVPFAPGGTTDIVARIIADRLGQNLRQAIVVENRAGAGGGIGTDAVAKAAPNGYTLLMGHIGALTINPAIYEKLPYQPLRDFAPISVAIVTPLILITGPTSGINSVAQLVALAKAQPEKLTYATAGAGSASHMASELLNFNARIKTIHIPFKGAGPATTAVVAGDVSFMFSGQGQSWPLVKAGKLRSLGLASLKRSPEHPDTPTIAEAGIPNFEMLDWNGLLAPAGTPGDIITKLNREVRTVLTDPAVSAKLISQGYEPRPGSPEDFTALIKSELEKWAQVAKTAGIKVD